MDKNKYAYISGTCSLVNWFNYFQFFSYNKMTNSGELKTLKNTSFPISSYSLIALVGAPGSGKTY